MVEEIEDDRCIATLREAGAAFRLAIATIQQRAQEKLKNGAAVAAIRQRKHGSRRVRFEEEGCSQD